MKEANKERVRDEEAAEKERMKERKKMSVDVVKEGSERS